MKYTNVLAGLYCAVCGTQGARETYLYDPKPVCSDTCKHKRDIHYISVGVPDNFPCSLKTLIQIVEFRIDTHMTL